MVSPLVGYVAHQMALSGAILVTMVVCLVIFLIAAGEEGFSSPTRPSPDPSSSLGRGKRRAELIAPGVPAQNLLTRREWPP